MLQCVAVCCSVMCLFHMRDMMHSYERYDSEVYPPPQVSVLQCVAVCCSVLQCVAV